MLSYTAAINQIFERLPDPVEELRNMDQAADHYLAEDIFSEVVLPGFDNSAMDGYAIKAADTAGAEPDAPVKLRIAGQAPAGHPFQGHLRSGQAVYINTGAVIPEGANAVIPVEDVEIIAEKEILVKREILAGYQIRFAGEEIQKGQQALKKHQYVSAACIGLLAALGKTKTNVFKKPSVGFLATGDELVQPDQEPGPGQIRNSNTYLIKTLVTNGGYDFYDYGIARDEKSSIIAKLTGQALPDVLITSAGVSMGEHDLVIEALETLGLKVQFWKVAVKPGKPLVFGLIGKTLFFGLPGNPVSGAVVFTRFVEPVLRAISGDPEPFESLYKATAGDEFKPTAGRLHFARGIAAYQDGWRVKSAGMQGSHILTSLARSNCFVMIPPDRKIEKGDEVYIQVSGSERMGLEEFNRSFSLLLK